MSALASSSAALDPLTSQNSSITAHATEQIIDFDFFVFVVGFLSICSVIEKSRTDKKSILARNWFLYYDLVQVVLNATVAFRIFSVLAEAGDLFGGFATQNTATVQNAVQVHKFYPSLRIIAVLLTPLLRIPF